MFMTASTQLRAHVCAVAGGLRWSGPMEKPTVRATSRQPTRSDEPGSIFGRAGDHGEAARVALWVSLPGSLQPIPSKLPASTRARIGQYSHSYS